MRIAVCPGTYDPVTFGHLDVIKRVAETFDRVIVAVVHDALHKGGTLFEPEERLAFLDDGLAGIDNVEIELFSELLVDFARRNGARTIVKGLRAISDFEWEFQLNHLNRTLAPDVETMYVMASPQYSFLSSSGVKEIAAYGGNVDEWVPKAVASRFKQLYAEGPAATRSGPEQ